jgi:hypothetical protein
MTHDCKTRDSERLSDTNKKTMMMDITVTWTSRMWLLRVQCLVPIRRTIRQVLWCTFIVLLLSSQKEQPTLVQAWSPPEVLAAESLEWAARSLLSAGLAYGACIAVFDRPRGQLLLPNDGGTPYLQVRPSSVPGAGRGVFVTAPRIPQGTPLGTYPGVVLPLTNQLPKLQRYPHCETYVWRFSDSRYIIDPTNAEGRLEDVSYGGNLATWGSVWFHQQLLPKLPWYNFPTTLLCRINEPPKAGRFFDVNVVTVEDLEARTVTFVAERDIYENEELFIDYGISYDRSGYGRTPEENHTD